MKKRLLSFVLCLVMVFALFPTFAAPALAADANGITNPAPTADPSGKLNLTKTLTPGANGAYDVNMESWSTGEVHAYTEKIPTDFVVVVDQSGSMDTRDMPTGTPTVQNNKYLEDIAAGAYYYKDGDNYYRVYGVKDYLFRYYPANTWFTGDIVDHLGTDIGWFMGQTDATHNIDNAFYYREVVNGTTYYIPIRTTIEGKVGTYYMKFSFPSKQTGSTYEFDRELTTYSTNGNSPWYHNVTNGELLNSGLLYEGADTIVQGIYRDDHAYTYSEVKGSGLLSWIHIRTGMYVNYPMYGRHLSYTKLCYRDVNGVEHTLPSNQSGQTVWEYCDDNGIARTTDSVTSARPTYSGLYTFPTQTDRITALKAALNQFAQAVANETDSFGPVDNRVSIVGFSSSGYNNTELLTHTERNITGTSTNGWQKDTCDGNVTEYYGKGLVGATDGNAGTVNAKISRAITAITANGGTQPEDGLNMAYKVLTNRSNTTYTIRSGEHKDETVDRNTVVIFFTDGQPGDYHYSDQYSEANEVVAQAKYIKDYGASLYSIGVFGESDANPLTYADTSQSQSNRQAWKYLGGWMETYQSGGTYYCLRRQWRPNNAEGYTATPNDTIFDYMSVVSSNYPDAKNFIAPAWLTGGFSGNYIAATDGDTVRQKSSAEATNKYYRMASNQDTLVAAFLAAVTMNNEETGTPVSINSTAVLQDKVNLDDFDTSNAVITAKVVNYSNNNEDAALSALLDASASDLANGIVKVSGFDYSRNYVVNDQGKKLVVTISGLTPKKATGTLKSNADTDELLAAGVYGAGIEKPSVSIASPTLVIPGSGEKTYIIDFNAEMKVATGAKKLGKTTGTNGVFTPGSGSTFDVFYKLGGGLDGKNFTASYSGVDSAMVYGQPVGETSGTAWNKITTVPANNIYFDDDLGQLTATENGSGYNSQIGVLKEETVADGPFTFTFKGSRIDIYCTTEGTSGGVTATLKQGDTVITNNIISNKYQGGGALYNVPTVVFEGLDPASEYTVTIRTNGSSSYKLDGVRVYNAAAETGDVAKAYSDAGEANSIFLKVRDQLLPNSATISTINEYLDAKKAYDDAIAAGETAEEPVMPDSIKNIPGVMFYMDTASEAGTDSLKRTAEYSKLGPKNEVYLSTNEGLSFSIQNAPADMQVWIGLSALQGNGGSVMINGVAYDMPISSTVDMYYPVTVKDGNVVDIQNSGSGLISVTNVKITGSTKGSPSLNASVLSVADAESAANVLSVDDGLPYLAVTPKLLNSLNAPAQAEDPEPTADPEPTPTADPEPTPTQQPSFAEWISNLLSSFVNALFGSIARLFGH